MQHAKTFIWRSLSIVVILTTAVVAASVNAATVTSTNDYPSTLQSGQSANHQVVFTTPTGAAEGSTILLTFASDFNTSSILEDDIDIADDGTDLTTAADCSGSEEASISIASDIVTITICSGDGGAIAATSVVTIEVGTNATSSGTGANQVVNPSSTATYYVSISGTFGDAGSIALPIGGDDSVSVTGTIPGGGGPGPGPGGGDVTAPTISSILVSEITGTTATVTWTTNELADSAVDYGETESFELGTESSTSLNTSHSIGLSGLTEGTVIYFRVRSSDANSNEATSSTQTFTTLDETAPVISDIEVSDITTTSARVTWITDENADSIVSYGETDEYGSTESNEDYETSHSILLTDLTEGTEYHFQVLSSDESLNQSYSDDETFTTESDDAPTNVSDLLVEEEDGVLDVSWTNPGDDDLAGILVLYCEDDYPTGPDDTSCNTALDDLAEEVSISGLTNGTTYYIGVFAYDEAGQFASGALGTGTPSAPDEELPPEDEDDDVPVPDETEDDDGGEDYGGGEEDDDDDEESEDDDVDEAVVCGDGICSESESEESCPADCAVDEPTSLGAEGGELDSEDVDYMVADGELELEATDSGVVDVLPTSTLSVEIPDAELVGEVESITLSIDPDDMYLMSLDEETALYSAEVLTPEDVATYLVSIEVTYSDGSKEYVSSLLRVQSNGIVYEDIDGEEAPLEGVTLTLFEQIGDELIVWDGSPYNQFNPTVTDSAGIFAWYVPNGIYLVTAQADGYDETDSGLITITNSIVNPSILMIASFIEEPIDEITQEPEPEPEAVAETVLGVVLDSPVVEVIEESLEIIRDLPGAQEAAEISIPALAVTAGASVVVLYIAFDFLPFLQYLFTAPILFFWRRRRKEYGVIYNAISKTPIDLAVVRLFQLTKEDEAKGKSGRLVKSRVTDKGGRYFFLVHPGRYRITATKAGFQFPTEYLQGELVDGSYLDLYHGEVIEVTSANAVVTANVPLDPSQADKYQAPASVMWRKRLRVLQHVVAAVGVIAALVFAVIRPTPFSIGMIVIQVVIYLLARRLAKPHKPISWGIVTNKETGRPLSRVAARIFEPKYNKLLETQVTDSKGRYAFMLGPNEYYAMFEKSGFHSKEITPIDYSQTKEPQGFSEDVEMSQKDSVEESKENK